ncbi:fumarylacetoacetate hydrolase family protein [Castellaniella sp.]|uniref:fumarylacetoacetate hydrolase family protein n=1 Tax=Castellaniella sp. TaxID=1955812 RepID=UPI003564E954
MTPPGDPAVPSVPVHTLAIAASGARFPVRRIYCVGRNYADHAREMGASGRELPFFFAKPADAAFSVPEGACGDLPYPPATADLHHEVELVVALASGGRNLSPEQAAQTPWGYAIGLDMTRRDLQAAAKKAGRPWETAKAFDFSAPMGPLHPVRAVGALSSGAIELWVNGQLRQSGDLADMIWSVPEAIAYLSTLFELRAGDLLFTGTPAGVGAVQVGDRLEARIERLGMLRLQVV